MILLTVKMGIYDVSLLLELMAIVDVFINNRFRRIVLDIKVPNGIGPSEFFESLGACAAFFATFDCAKSYSYVSLFVSRPNIFIGNKQLETINKQSL